MAIMQCGKCLVRWVFDNATKILSAAKAFDKILLTERNVKSKCKHISDLKSKPHPEQRHAEVISRSSTSNLMASQLENECVKRRKEKKRAERLANAERRRATRHEEKRGECFAPCFPTFSFAQRRADDPKITSEASGETLKSPEIEILATL